MLSITYEDPSGRTTTPVDANALRNAVLDLPEAYWRVGSGSAALSYETAEAEVQLLLLPNLALGRIYLKLLIRTADGLDTWLSLHEPAALSEIVSCDEDWSASKGLFLPPPRAWIAIEHFLATGERAPEISWATPESLPEDANW